MSKQYCNEADCEGQPGCACRKTDNSHKPTAYQDLKDRLDIAERESQDIRNNAVRLADALMDINNVLGDDYHVKIYVAEVDSIMREYHGLDIK